MPYEGKTERIHSEGDSETLPDIAAETLFRRFLSDRINERASSTSDNTVSPERWPELIPETGSNALMREVARSLQHIGDDSAEYSPVLLRSMPIRRDKFHFTKDDIRSLLGDRSRLLTLFSFAWHLLLRRLHLTVANGEAELDPQAFGLLFDDRGDEFFIKEYGLRVKIDAGTLGNDPRYMWIALLKWSVPEMIAPSRPICVIQELQYLGGVFFSSTFSSVQLWVFGNSMTTHRIGVKPLQRDINLKTERGASVVSLGLQFSPSGLRFNKPIKVTLPHCALLSRPADVKVVLYTKENGQTNYTEIPVRSKGIPRCVVRKQDFDLYINHFSEWWVVMKLESYFIGKRVACTPYVRPASAWYLHSNSQREDHCVRLCIHDDIPGLAKDIREENAVAGFHKADVEEQFYVKWRSGDVRVSLIEEPKKPIVQNQTLSERAFHHLNRHHVTFVLGQLPTTVHEKFLVFRMKQDIQKEIGFIAQFRGFHQYFGRELEPPVSRLGYRQSKHGEDREVVREQHLSDSNDIETSAGAHQVELGRNSNSETYCKSVKAFVDESPITDSAPSIEHHWDNFSRDLPRLNGPITSRLFPSVPYLTGNMYSRLPHGQGILQHSADVEGKPNVYAPMMQYEQHVHIHPPGESPPVQPIRHILPWNLELKLDAMLTAGSQLTGDDWRCLAEKLGLGDYIDTFAKPTVQFPVVELLRLAERQGKIKSLEDLRDACQRLSRDDCVDEINKHMEIPLQIENATRHHSNSGDEEHEDEETDSD